VRLRLRSDVIVGSCLSGGLDSSSIVCVANQLLRDGEAGPATAFANQQKTFTATYDVERYREDAHVAHVIERTGAEAHFTKPNAETLWDDLIPFVRSQDEPFISTSMYAQWCVMRLAAEHGVKVLLDGQGGDEVLGGYRWHWPVFLSDLAHHGQWSRVMSEARAFAAVSGEPVGRLLAETAAKLGKPLIPDSMIRRSQPIDRYVLPPVMRSFTDVAGRIQKHDTSLQRRLWSETTRYNLRQLLHYEDRNSMAFSIEARVPFLDYRLVEYAMSVPGIYKIRDGWTKLLLRQGMEGILPEPIRWRRDKMGFVTPESDWIRHLTPRLLSLLRDGRWRSERFVDRTLVLDLLGRPSWDVPSQDLWRLVNLELWMRTFEVS
jgi:asparagine synthase (glutamine-hydrolysing)